MVPCRQWAVIVVLVATLPATAHAATEQVVATGDIGADVAIDRAGRAFLVSPSTQHYSAPFSSVRARSAGAGSVFGRSRMLLRSSRADRAVNAGVAADGSGVIVVQSLRRTDRRVRVVTFGARGPVGEPVTLSPRGGSSDFAASAVARSGAAVVVWFRHRSGGRWRLEAAIRDPGRGGFGEPQPLSAFVRRPCCTRVSVAIGERGDAVATWTSTARPGVWAVLRTPGRRFRPPQRLAEDSSGVPSAVVGARGTAALTYGIEHVPRRASDGLQLRRAVRGGPFAAAEQVDPGCAASLGEAAVTSAGRVLVACVDKGDGQESGRVRVSEAGPGEPLAPTGELGTDVVPERLAVAVDDDGRAVVAWPQLASRAGPRYRERAFAAVRQAPDAPFGAPVALGRAWSAAEPGLARLVPRGGALVVWRASHLDAPAKRRVALVVTRLP